MNKKTAITLIELIVSVTTASILFILLGNIISKKLNAVSLVYEKGTYYCWKDWNGTLYQKTPMGNIQAVSTCKVKIPKNAQNIQTFIIGGGASGFIFDKNTIDSYLSQKTATQESKAISCIEEKNYPGYTALKDSGYYKDLTTISSEQKNKLNNTLISVKTLHNQLLSSDFTKSLIQGGHCVVPVYKDAMYASYKLPADAKYYSIGSDKTEKDCKEAQSINDLGTCFEDGFIKGSSLSDINISMMNASNNLRLETIQTKIEFSDYIKPLFQQSSPGEVVMGTAEAGREYTITSDNIGNGGVKGENGKETKFAGSVARGGVLKNETLSISTKTVPVSSVKNQEPALISLCSPTETKCNGTFNNGLIGKNLEVKADKVISVNFNPKTDSDESVKTGFGLFGASGAAQDCQIQYYQIKKVTYNSYSEEIEGPIATMSSCKSNLTNGMGGAVIIRWE